MCLVYVFIYVFFSTDLWGISYYPIVHFTGRKKKETKRKGSVRTYVDLQLRELKEQRFRVVSVLVVVNGGRVVEQKKKTSTFHDKLNSLCVCSMHHVFSIVFFSFFLFHCHFCSHNRPINNPESSTLYIYS